MTAPVRLRDERAADAGAIAALVSRAFEGHPHSSGTEATIVARLRGSGGSVLSLVAEEPGGSIVGHVVFSPAFVDGAPRGWHTLGPLSVAPERQRSGIGSLLVRDGIDRLRSLGSSGCLLVGDPAYYCRFGFAPSSGLIVDEPLMPYLQVLPFGDEKPVGRVSFHPAFDG